MNVLIYIRHFNIIAIWHFRSKPRWVFFYFSRISIFATNPKNRYPLVAMSIKLNTKLESDLNSNNAMQRYWGFKSQFFPNYPNPRSLLKIYIKDTLTIIRNYFENLKVGRTFIGVSIFESF